MFLKSVLQVGPSPRTAPPPSLHVFLAMKLQPQNLAMREPQTSAKVLRLRAYRIVQENLSECCSHHSYPCFLFVVLSGEISRERASLAGREGCLLELGKVRREARLGAQKRWEDLPFPLLAPVTKAFL